MLFYNINPHHPFSSGLECLESAGADLSSPTLGRRGYPVMCYALFSCESVPVKIEYDFVLVSTQCYAFRCIRGERERENVCVSERGGGGGINA